MASEMSSKQEHTFSGSEWYKVEYVKITCIWSKSDRPVWSIDTRDLENRSILLQQSLQAYRFWTPKGNSNFTSATKLIIPHPQTKSSSKSFKPELTSCNKDQLIPSPMYLSNPFLSPILIILPWLNVSACL